jgi:aminoglycoside 6-adenylyltransferase
MRSESEIYNLINKITEYDERIRAVLLNGSRANPIAKKDKFQDFDIIFIVKEFDSFIRDHSWVDIFGKRLIMQMPDTMITDKSDDQTGVSFAYLMLFEDGNRIDLTLLPDSKFSTDFVMDSLTKVLLDKDGLFPELPPPSDEDYWIQKPTNKEFNDCSNEFWWVSTYVAKGLVREEITYAKAMMDGPVRKMFMNMLAWNIGVKTNFTTSFGKDGRSIKKNVSSRVYIKILSTYPDHQSDHIWNSLFIMTDLFLELSEEVGGQLNFISESKEAKNVLSYLKKIRGTYEN